MCIFIFPGPGGEFDEIVPTLNPTSVDGGGLTGSRVIQIACGKNHMAAVTDVGELFTWGDNRCSQLGLSSSSTVSFDSTFELIPYSPAVSPPAEASYSFYSGTSYSTTTAATTTPAPILAKTQYLSTFSNQNSRNSIPPSLSVPVISYTIPLSTKVATDLEAFSSCGPVLIHHLRDVKVAAVACGAHHTLCLSDDGKVYSWGRGANGRLGQYADSLDIPDCTVGSATLVKTHNNWIAEEFELFHSPSSSSSFSSRCPTYRGTSDITPTDTTKPEIIDDSHPKQSIVTNDDYFSFASIYASAIPATNSFVDKKMTAPSSTSIAVTSDSDADEKGTSATTVSKLHKFSTPTKQIDTTRHPIGGLTAIGTPSLPPSLMFPNKIICIAAGLAHSLAVTACGTVFTWGCGTNGRLGHGSHCDEFYPRQVIFLIEVAAPFFTIFLVY